MTKRWEVRCTIQRSYRFHKSRWIARQPKVTSVSISAETGQEAVQLAREHIEKRLTGTEFIVHHLTSVREL